MPISFQVCSDTSPCSKIMEFEFQLLKSKHMIWEFWWKEEVVKKKKDMCENKKKCIKRQGPNIRSDKKNEEKEKKE